MPDPVGPDSANDSDPVLDQLITALEELADRVSANSDTLAAHDEHLGGLAETVARGHWDPDQPDTMDEWVAKLIEDYYLADELHDWQHNTAIRNELAALRIAWRRMTSDQASPWDAVTWHDALARSRARWPDHNTRRRRQ